MCDKEAYLTLEKNKVIRKLAQIKGAHCLSAEI